MTEDEKPTNIKLLRVSSTAGQDAVPEVVSILEKMLAKAERGEIRSIGIAAGLIEGECLYGVAGQEAQLTLAAAIGMLHHKHMEDLRSGD